MCRVMKLVAIHDGFMPLPPPTHHHHTPLIAMNMRVVMYQDANATRPVMPTL